MSTLPTVVLTGASAGIGLAAFEALVQEAFVIAISRTPPPLPHHNVHWLKGDLRTPEPVARAVVEYLETSHSSLDGLIHCAVSYGADRRHAFLETRDCEWDEIMAVNVRSEFILTVRLLPLLLQSPRAFIVALSSDIATLPAPDRIAYGCSKAATHALFSGLAVELSESQVSVIQMLPKRQVVTRGIQGRRPPGFDFSDYSSPDIFKGPFKTILRTRGAGMHGQCLVVS